MSNDASTPVFEVQTYTLCDGWVNTWSVTENDVSKPHQFATREEARAEIDEFLANIQAEIDNGEREEDEGYSEEDFRIVSILDGVVTVLLA